jgi:8-oxo-dGTP pyrophosphatase MutT (NUDIX family)
MSDGGSLPQQAAAIPFRRIGENVQVCLIRRKGSEAWGIPKGLVDPGDTSEETALNETWEEAGLRGRLIGDSIGIYRYEKWGKTFTVAVYVLEVLEQEGSWQEASFRERRWIPFAEAISLLSSHPVRPLLDCATRVLAGLSGRGHS